MYIESRNELCLVEFSLKIRAEEGSDIKCSYYNPFYDSLKEDGC